MLKGSLVALVTPFTGGKVDEDTLRELVEFHIENGTNGIVPCGTTGESATLTHDEHRQVIKAVVEQVGGRIPVVAGTGSNNTAEAVELTKYAKEVGADAALLITPYYNKPTQEGLYLHFKAIADATKFPLVPYNIKSRTGINVETPTMARIAELPEVVAVKEASGDINQMADVYRFCGHNLNVLSGDDAMLLPLLAIGGKGIISVVNNIVPRDVADVIAAWEAGEVALAQKRFYKLLPLVKAMFIETNPIPVKTAMAMVGRIPSDEMRLPMCPMSDANRAKLQEALTAYGLL